MIHFVHDFSDITFRLRSWNVQGAIFLGLFDEEIKEIQNNNHIPLVFTDSYSNVRQLINIGIDDYKGGELAATYFLQMGHTNLGFAGPFTKVGGVVTKRYQGFCDTLEQKQIKIMPNHLYDLEKITANDIIDSIINDPHPPTGIFTFSDQFALYLYSIANKKGLSIPKDLSIIGFDDLPTSHFLPFTLTTIQQDIRKKATETCRILFEHINDPDKPSQSIILDVQLIERESVIDRKK